MSTKGIVTVLEQYKSEVELRRFAEAQMQTINDLTKRVKELEEKNKHLEDLLISTNPIEQSEEKSSLAMEDEEQIVVMQIKRLRDVSLERELTLEESRKLEIYYKILSSIQNKPRTIVVKAKKLSDDELLQLNSTPDNDE